MKKIMNNIKTIKELLHITEVIGDGNKTLWYLSIEKPMMTGADGYEISEEEAKHLLKFLN